ncbi:MAG: DUF1652 domain-containing protein [Janthinobacterium lividum]
MAAYGLSTLEIKHLIERALLPDRCECEILDGNLSLTLTATSAETSVIRIKNIKFDSLNSSRAIAELVGEARYQLVSSMKEHRPLKRRNSFDS